MTGKEKTVPDVETTGNGMGEKISQPAINLPSQQYTTEEVSVQGVAAMLPRGAENAISTSDLVKICGAGNVRKLREIIAYERASGALILSNTTGGYFLPSEGEKGREEMRHFVNTIRSKALNLLKAARPARAALRVLDGQEKLECEG